MLFDIFSIAPILFCYLDSQIDWSESLLVFIRESRVQFRAQLGGQPGQDADMAMTTEDVEDVVAEMVRQVPDQSPLHVLQRLLLQQTRNI